MAFQKFIAWENLPSLIAKPDDVDSSSSSSKSENGSKHEPEKDLNVKLKVTTVKPEIGLQPKLEIPPSVKNVLDKLDMGQLERAKKDVSKKLYRILDNVNRTYEHYRKDDRIDPEIEKEYHFSQTWAERNRRSHFLDVIADVLDESKFKIQELQMVLESFKNMFESLKTTDLREKGTSYDDMIDDMEEHLLKFINSIDNNIQRLIKIFHPLIKEKIKSRRKSAIRPDMFKAWRDKVAEKPKEGEPLTPERMLEDEHLTLTHCNDVVFMTQEMVDSSVFNRTEHDAIKYIAVMVANLTKAFNLLSKQCRGLKIKNESLAALDTRKQDPQVGHLQRELHVALDKKAALEMQVHAVEEQCKILLITNETMQKELQDANERAMTMGKVSFLKLPSSKTPEKIPLDAEKEVKSKVEKSSVKPPAPSVKLPSAKPDEKEKHVETPSGKLGDTGKVQEGHLPPHSISAQEGGIKLDEKDQEKDRFPEAGGAADISFDERQPDIAQKSRKEKAPLEERAPKTPEEKSLPEKKAQKTPKEKTSLEEKRPQSPEAVAALKEESPLIDTTKEDGQALEKQLLSEEKGQVAPSKLKTTKVVRRPSKLSKWKNVQTSLLKQPTKSRDETTLLESSKESVIISDDTSMMQLYTVHGTAVTQPATPDDTSVTHPATIHDTAVTHPVTIHDTAVTQPATIHDTAVTQPATINDTAVTQPSIPDDTSVIHPVTFDHRVVTQPATLDDTAVEQPEMLDDTVVTKSTSLRDTEELLLQASVDSPPKPGAEEDTPSTSPEGELPLLRRQSTLDTSSSSEKTRGKRKISLKLTAGKVVQTINEKKVVKFTGDSIVQRTSVSRETLDTQSAESPQAGTAEGTEDSAVGTLQPQKRLAGKVKEIHEKKDTKRTGKMTASVSQSKQAEMIEDVLHGLGTKLQDIARDRGGVIEAETIKEIFEELSITYHDTARGQMSGSYPIDKPGKGSTAQSPSLPPPAAEHAPRKEGQKSLEDVGSAQDVSSALQEFQAAILACLEDKLDKARKGTLDTQKQSVKFQPRDPQVQQLFQAIDKKLEEYTSMKQKIPIGVKKHKMLSSVQSKEEEREVRVITSSFYDTLSVEGHPFSHSSFSLFRTESEEQTTSGEASQLMAWEEEEEELEHEVEKEIKLEEEKGEEEVKEKKQEEEQEMEQVVEQERKQKKIQGQLKKLKEETKYQREKISSLGGQLAKLEEDEDEDQMSPPQEEKRSPEHLQFERPLQGRPPWWDRKKQRIQQTSDEQLKHIRRRKESKPVSEMVSLQESDEGKELWKEQLQEETEQLQEETERLQGEKERLQEELRRLQEERQRLEEEEKQLEQWKQMFEQQRLQWEFEQQQHKEQEHLWQMQLQHWEQLQQQNEEQAQRWSAHREQQKEQQSHLQEEIERLQEEYREYLKMRGEQAEEQWRWSQLRTWHQQQEAIWREEDQEHEQKRVQWQEQLAQHQEQIESLRREREEQEQEMKKWQQERQERQDGLQQLWKKWWQKQLESWHRQMQKQRAQHHKWQEHSNQLQEKQQQQQMSKEAKFLAPQLKVVESSVLDLFSKDYKASPAHKERRPSSTPQLTPIPSSEFEEDTLQLETTWFPKLFSKAGDFPAPEVTEKRYLLNIEGQRKNLELLKGAAQNADVSSELYTKAKSIISQALHSNVERLALLFQKYKTLHHLQEARRSLTIQLDAAKDIKDGSKMQNLYKMVGKLDAYQKKVLDNWTVKQNAVEKKRRRCIEKMTQLFAQIRMSTKLRLSDPRPLMVKAGEDTKKEILHMPQIGSVFLKPKVGKSPLISLKKPTDFTFSAVVREPSSEQLESLWKTDITELSIPLGPKTPVSVLWSEAYGYPDIPRLLELDISSIRKKPLRNLKTRIQNIPRWKIAGYNFMHL